ncbi:MAG: flagellar assembly protein FliH [Burkholderiaceae bacterium]
MSDATVPKEQQTAYQRWEMNSFGDNRASTRTAAGSAANNKLTIEQTAQLREEARAKGYADGLAEGRAAGLAQGRAEAAGEITTLQTLAESFSQEVIRADELISQDLMGLALDIAKAMLKTSMTVHPELILPIVGEAIHYLPSLQQPAILFLNPADVAIVKDHMSDELNKAGWRISEDMQLQRGGCRIETATNQIDASTQTRWQRIAEALGKESDWLA